MWKLNHLIMRRNTQNYSSNLLLKVLGVVTIAFVSVCNAEQESYVSKSSGTTRIKFEKLKFTWTIENFSLYNLGNGRSLTSPSFTGEAKGSCKYQLLVYPDGQNLNYKDYVSLSLTTLKCPVRLQYKFGILNTQFKEINTYNGTFVLKSVRSEVRVELPNFINKEFLLNQKTSALPHDKLTIICELNATLGDENIAGTFKQPKLQSYLGNNLSYLFENQNFTDVVLSSGGKEFHALTAILAARSKMLKTMFENDWQEGKITEIEIADLDYEVLREMLRYIYTEQVFNLEYLAVTLLGASEKYGVDGLKSLCVSSMVENLTIENAAEFYVLSDTHSADDLKIKVKDFIAGQVSSIIRTSGFKSMIKTHPHLVEELFGTLSDLSKSCIRKI